MSDKQNLAEYLSEQLGEPVDAEDILHVNRKESIRWIDVLEQLPDAGIEVMVCFERNDCEGRDTCVAVYDDSLLDDGECPWVVPGALMHFGIVVYWAEKPSGPPRPESV